jgi:UDP-N-acetylglucosamine acyltransferase
MSIAPSARIHPTAIISPEAELAERVEVGPYAVLEGKVVLGTGCQVRAGAHLVGPLTMGQGNQVYTGAVLGEQPQHIQYKGEPTSVEVGDFNIFREHVTVHRGTTASWTTKIGSHNFFMANSHVAHDCRVGDRCILANNALVGGHCEVADNVFLSGNSALHQYVRVGRLALLSGCSATTKDIPPFVIQQNIDTVVGVNVIGMRRAGIARGEIDAVRRAFHILFRRGLTLPAALAQLQKDLPASPAVAEMVAFLCHTRRGINPMRGRAAVDEAA